MRNKKLWNFWKQIKNKEHRSSLASTFLECFQILLFNTGQSLTHKYIWIKAHLCEVRDWNVHCGCGCRPVLPLSRGEREGTLGKCQQGSFAKEMGGGDQDELCGPLVAASARQAPSSPWCWGVPHTLQQLPTEIRTCVIGGYISLMQRKGPAEEKACTQQRHGWSRSTI